MFQYFNTHWVKALDELISNGTDLVMVTVVKVEGSAPRKSSSRMLVTHDGLIETIGGGNLEHEACLLARKLLGDPQSKDYQLELYGLGPALQQCCGGAVTLAFEKITQRPDWLDQSKDYVGQDNTILVSRYAKDHVTRHYYHSVPDLPEQNDEIILIERFNPIRPTVVIFGAGHVGCALMNVLSTLPFKIYLVDERKSVFPASLPGNVFECNDAPVLQMIDKLPEHAINIVMTHSHVLDEDICFKYLKEKEFYFLGLIGSKTKRARFLHRLRDRGISQERLAQLTCPIGVAQVTGSRPEEIAIAVAAQLLNLRDKICLDNALL